MSASKRPEENRIWSPDMDGVCPPPHLLSVLAGHLKGCAVLSASPLVIHILTCESLTDTNQTWHQTKGTKAEAQGSLSLLCAESPLILRPRWALTCYSAAAASTGRLSLRSSALPLWSSLWSGFWSWVPSGTSNPSLCLVFFFMCSVFRQLKERSRVNQSIALFKVKVDLPPTFPLISDILSKRLCF